jgi:hypothetical protein
VHAADGTSRVAGAVVALVGALNLVIGVLSSTTDHVRLSTGAAGGFVAVGVALLAVGVLVWRGSRAATIGAFAVALGLLLLQIGQLALADTGDAAAAAASPDEPIARLVVLAVLVVTLGLAAWRRRRAPGPSVTAAAAEPTR